MAEELLSCEHPTSRNPSSKKQGNKPARTAGKRYSIRFIWDEPGNSGGSRKIETRTKTYPGEREKDRKDNAIKEAVRLA